VSSNNTIQHEQHATAEKKSLELFNKRMDGAERSCLEDNSLDGMIMFWRKNAHSSEFM